MSEPTHPSPASSGARSSAGGLGSGPKTIVVLVILLLILHQDNWFWSDGTLVFGFMPIGLFWHACISVGATLTWLLATRIAWPFDQDSSRTEGGE